MTTGTSTPNRLSCMSIESAEGDTLWTRFPFYPLERAAVALRQLTAQHGSGLSVKLAYEDPFGRQTGNRDITEQVLAVPRAVVDRVERLDASQPAVVSFQDVFAGLGCPAST